MNIEEKILLSIAGVLVALLVVFTYNVISNPAPVDDITITCKVEK
jgi:hypothetical protein